MMSIYGFIGGIGDGLADTGKAMQTDALEARRQQRLEEARARQEQRANAEWSRRQDETFTRTYGVDADPNAGTRALDTQHEFKTKFGAGADPSRGMAAYEKDYQLGLYGEKARIDLGTHRNKGRIDNEINAYGEPFEHPTAGLMQTGPDGQLRPVGRGAGATALSGDRPPPAAIATVEWIAKHITDGDRRAAWELAQRSKSNPQEFAARLYMSRKREAEANFENITDEEIKEEVRRAMSLYPDFLDDAGTTQPSGQDESPPMEGARKAPDGNWYIQQDGKWFRVD